MNVHKTAVAAVLSILLTLFLVSPLLKAGLQEPSAPPVALGPSEALWTERGIETLLQGLIILSGVFAILMLLRGAKRVMRT